MAKIKSLSALVEQIVQELIDDKVIEDKFPIRQKISEILTYNIAEYGAEKYVEGTKDERNSWTGRL